MTRARKYPLELIERGVRLTVCQGRLNVHPFAPVEDAPLLLLCA